jgi:hypothetical protein
MYMVGIVKPVYMIKPRTSKAAGTIARDMVRETDAIVRNRLDVTTVLRKATKRKKNRGPASRRRFAMRYNVRLKHRVLSNLYGMSVSILATASADGW